jgi:hypothetical protein
MFPGRRHDRGPTRRPARRPRRRRRSRRPKTTSRSGFLARRRELVDGANATELLDLRGIHRHGPCVRIDRGAGATQRVERAIPEDLHPDLRQDPQRRRVDRLDLVADRISIGRYGLTRRRHGTWRMPPAARRPRRGSIRPRSPSGCYDPPRPCDRWSRILRAVSGKRVRWKALGWVVRPRIGGVRDHATQAACARRPRGARGSAQWR